MVVVKQSMAAMLSTFGGMGAALACTGLTWGLSEFINEQAALAICAAVLLIIGGMLLCWLHTRGAERFENL